MQQLIERINKAAEGLKSTKEHGPFEYGQYSILIGILNDAEEMIKQERDMVERAWINGKETEGFGNTIWEDAENYYNKQYGGNYGTTNKE